MLNLFTLFLFSNALTIKKEKSTLFSRTVLSVFIFSIFLASTNLFIIPLAIDISILQEFIIEKTFGIYISDPTLNFSSTEIYGGIYSILTTFRTIVYNVYIFNLFLVLVHYTVDNLSYYLLSGLFLLIIGYVLGITQFRIKTSFSYSTISHLDFILLALSKHFLLNKLYTCLEYIFYSTPKPHPFSTLPTGSNISINYIAVIFGASHIAFSIKTRLIGIHKILYIYFIYPIIATITALVLHITSTCKFIYSTSHMVIYIVMSLCIGTTTNPYLLLAKGASSASDEEFEEKNRQLAREIRELEENKRERDLDKELLDREVANGNPNQENTSRDIEGWDELIEDGLKAIQELINWLNN